MMEKIEELLKYLISFQWNYIAYAIPVFIVIVIFYFRQRKTIFAGFSGFIQWLRPSFETGGFASSEKVTAAVIGATAIVQNIIFMLSDADPYHKLCAIGMAYAFILILFKILTPQQLQELKDGISPSKANNKTDEK